MATVIFQPARHLLRQKIAQYSKFIKGKVLDVGSGSYQRYIDLFDYSQYLTLDIDPANKPNIIGSADQIPLADNSVDSVVCNQVLGDLLYPQKAIDEIYRVLKPNGYVLLTENFSASELDIQPLDYWRFTNFAFKELFNQAGFKIIKIEPTSGFFASIAQSYIRYIINRFKLYQRPWARWCNPPIKIYSYFMIWLDKKDKSPANKRVTIDWLVLAQKRND